MSKLNPRRLRLLSLVLAVLTLTVSLTGCSKSDAAKEKPLEGMKIALLIAGEGYDEANVATDYLVEQGATVTPVGIEKGSVPILGTDQRPIVVDTLVTEVSGDSFDCIVIPGGKSPAVLAGDQSVHTFVKQAYDKGLILAAICAGPQVLGAAGLAKDRNVTVHPNFVTVMRDYGARVLGSRVVVDGTLITAQDGTFDVDAFLKTLTKELAKKKGS